MPSLLTRLENLGQAVSDVAKDFTATRRVVSQEGVAASRLAICQSCDFFVPKKVMCSHPKCGCFLRVKTHLHAMKCPSGKW